MTTGASEYGSASTLLKVQELSVTMPTAGGHVSIIDRVSFSLNRGERLALVGESGSGKSVTALSVMRLLTNARMSGKICLEGEDLLAASDKRMRAVRGDRIGIVSQDPLSSLDPTMSIGSQVAEPLLIRGVARKEAARRAVAMLDRLGVPDASHRARAFPHEFSGGMRQRVCLAIALIADPDIIIADEPTTALDVRMQAQVLDLLDQESSRRGLAVLFITHDLAIVAGFADRVAVMYAGRLVEQAGVGDLFRRPQHPYTRGLLGSVPRVDQDLAGALQTIPGTAPTPADRPSGCAFHPRCPERFDRCDWDIPQLESVRGDLVACHAVIRGTGIDMEVPDG